jgi:hypothetical protein
MKNLLIIFFFLVIAQEAFSGTCTSTTRNNYSTNQVLTSSALNADFNQLVTKVNALDGGCITDGTLEAAALNSTEFSAIYYGVTQGCKVSYSDSNTLSVGKCIASVNGNFIKTASDSTVTWGCSGCASEAATTTYYVYIKTGSVGSTLNLSISTTAPNGDGYNNGGDKALAKFYNNASSNIDQYKIENWLTSGFYEEASTSAKGNSRAWLEALNVNGGSGITSYCGGTNCTRTGQTGNRITQIDRGVGTMTITFDGNTDTSKLACAASLAVSGIGYRNTYISSVSSNSIVLDTGGNGDFFGQLWCIGND